MLRLRIPGGQLTPQQAIKIGELAKTYGNDYIDITMRQQIELEHLKIEDIPTLLRELDSVGISTYQTGGDNFRNIVTSAFDGIGQESFIESMPLIESLQAIFLKQEEWLNQLPGRFNTAILGNRINDCNIYGHDCCYVLAQRDGKQGFNVYLGGDVGVQALDANVFVTVDEVVPFYRTLIEIFKAEGFRYDRETNRLRPLIESIGLKKLIERIKEESDIEFAHHGTNLVYIEHRIPEDAVIALNDDKVAVAYSVPSGILRGSDMLLAGETARRYNGCVRLSVEQSFYIAGVQGQSVEAIKSEELYQKYQQYNNLYFRNLIAYAGTKSFASDLIPNKQDAIELFSYLSREVPIEDAKVRIYWSICSQGCGVHGIADIGFESCKVIDEAGNSVEGVDIFLGGKATTHALEARLLYKSVPLSEAKYIIKNLMEIYKNERFTNESFELFDTRVLHRLSVEEICEKIGV
jgi:ferredoxin-nitrite reductase